MNGALVRECRVQRQLTQEQLAHLVGTTLRTVQRWERGSHAPQPTQRRRLAQVLGLKISELTRNGQGAA